MKSVFLGDCKSSTRGSEGLMYSFDIIFDNMGIENLIKNKLTGRWEKCKYRQKYRPLRSYETDLVKDLLCVCCVAHMSRYVWFGISNYWTWALEIKYKICSNILSSFCSTLWKTWKNSVMPFVFLHILNLVRSTLKKLSSSHAKILWIINPPDSWKTEKAFACVFFRHWMKNSEHNAWFT